nr:T9SS type A sorting domain-containing protein [uncultured Psychroserpens sp.]
MKIKLLFPLFALLFSMTLFSQTINDPTAYELCDIDNDDIEPFDLHFKDAEILNGLSPNNFTVTYYETQADADASLNALSSPYFNVANPQAVYVNVTDNTTGNIEQTTLTLVVIPSPTGGFAQDVIACDEGGGFATFDLTAFDAEFINGESDVSVSYYETSDSAFLGINQITNPQNYINTIPYQQTIFVRLDNVLTGCFTSNTNAVLYLNVDQQITITEPTPFIVCDDDDDGFYTFNLDVKTEEILGGIDNPTYIVTYHLSQVDADNNTNIIDPIFTNTTAFGQVVYARVSSTFGDCFQTTLLELVVDIDCLTVTSTTIAFCTDDPNFLGDFDLTSQNSEIVNGQDISEFNFTYYLTEVDAANQSNPIPDPTVFQSGIDPQLIYVYVEEIATGNSAITTIAIVGSLNPQVDFNDPYTICSGQEIVLTPYVDDMGQYTYLWSTGATDPEIVVFTGGTYTVTVTNPDTGCMTTAEVFVDESEGVDIVTPQDLVVCDGNNGVFDLTSVITEVLNGVDPNSVAIAFYTNLNDVFNQVNPIANPNQYTAVSSPQTIYIRVSNIDNQCFAYVAFNLISENCPIEVICDQEPVNINFCYEINSATPYTFESDDGSPLYVEFNAGQVEIGWDELVVLDSDGVTNLNPQETTYGVNGDLTGLAFISSGSSLTIYVESDEVFSCASEGYTPIDFDVSCFDDSLVPNCNATLIAPLNGAVDVNENIDLEWNPATIIVNGYRVSVGITSGGTEIIDNQDVGDVLTLDIGNLDYEVTYYVNIIPYNDNGDAEDCVEESFTTRANPNQMVACEDGAINTTYCYGLNDTTEFAFESSDGLPLTLVFNAGTTEVNYDEVTIVDSDGTILNPNLPYGNAGDFTGLTYTSSGSNISVLFDSDGSISCESGSTCCTEQFDFDVFCASAVGFIQVNAFVDDNLNNVFDTNELSFYNGYFTYEINDDGNINTVNSSTGSFQIISGDETDTYDITFNLYEESAGCYDVTIPVFNDISVTTGNTITVDFPVVEEQSCEDLAVYLINPWIAPRPGFTHDNYIILENLGFTTITSGTVEFTNDAQLIYNGVTSVNSNYTITPTATGFTVDFVNLQPGDSEQIEISLTCPASVAIGEIVTNTATYITASNDLVEVNNYSTLSELVVGSWDPNDKMESHGPRILYDDFVVSDEYLYYTIRFQNLGTAPATFIRIDDALDNQLDETTFQMLRSSHDNVVTRTDNNLEWYFDNINLPAEQDDADGSQGYVYFRIKPKAGYVIGDIIPNTAAIYFDFNAPVITNRFDSEFVEESLSVSESSTLEFDMYPNPAKETLTITLNASSLGNVTLDIVDLQGKLVLEKVISQSNTIDVNVSDLQSGLYFVKLNASNKTLVEKLIIK